MESLAAALDLESAIAPDLEDLDPFGRIAEQATRLFPIRLIVSRDHFRTLTFVWARMSRLSSATPASSDCPPGSWL